MKGERESFDVLVDRLFHKVKDHMKWDGEKTALWFRTPNRCLGLLSPVEFVLRRPEKAEKWIDSIIVESRRECSSESLHRLGLRGLMSDVKLPAWCETAAEEYTGFPMSQWTGEIGHSGKAFLAACQMWAQRLEKTKANDEVLLAETDNKDPAFYLGRNAIRKELLND